MKKSLQSGLSLVLLCLVVDLCGQQYQVTYSASVYESLSDFNVVDETNPIDFLGFPVYESIPIGFNFDFQGTTFNELAICENGYAVFSTLEGPHSFLSFFDCDLINYFDNPALSPIHYKTEGPEGDRIFKCEMVKVGFAGDDEGSDFAYVQLWLYENCDDFEIRIGQISIDPTEDDLFWNGNTTPIFAYGIYNPSSYYILAGDPTAPLLQTDPFTTLDELPSNGTIYRFSDCAVGISDLHQHEMKFFPNPVTDNLNIELDGISSTGMVQIYDMNGQLLEEIPFQHQMTFTVDTSELNSGMYLIKLISDEAIYQSKLFSKL